MGNRWALEPLATLGYKPTAPAWSTYGPRHEHAISFKDSAGWVSTVAMEAIHSAVDARNPKINMYNLGNSFGLGSGVATDTLEFSGCISTYTSNLKCKWFACDKRHSDGLRFKAFGQFRTPGVFCAEHWPQVEARSPKDALGSHG